MRFVDEETGSVWAPQNIDEPMVVPMYAMLRMEPGFKGVGQQVLLSAEHAKENISMARPRVRRAILRRKRGRDRD